MHYAHCSLFKTIGIFHFIMALLLFFSFTIHTNTYVDLEVQHNKILVMATILYHFTAFPWLFSRIIIYWCFLYFSMSLFIKEFDYTVETVEYKQEFYQQNSTVQSIVCKYACIRSSWNFLNAKGISKFVLNYIDIDIYGHSIADLYTFFWYVRTMHIAHVRYARWWDDKE